MPRILPVRYFEGGEELAGLCRNRPEPVFLTRNGYGELVVMSMELYERMVSVAGLAETVLDAEREAGNGELHPDAGEALAELRRGYENGLFG